MSNGDVQYYVQGDTLMCNFSLVVHVLLEAIGPMADGIFLPIIRILDPTLSDRYYSNIFNTAKKRLLVLVNPLENETNNLFR